MKKRIMIVGPTQSGKSTLANFLNDTDRPLKKTQDVIYGKYTIDTPGSYIETPYMYRYLIATAQGASCILLLVDQTKPFAAYPPAFAKTFTCPVIGVVTRVDLAGQNARLCMQQLQRIGVKEPFFRVSVKDAASLRALKEYLLGKYES
ncbi:EutP/PduV family microcompartment system protein [Desulforamulus hydrothermalis]|uniref:Putative nucleoside triphosphate hydrolase domain protein n=1 Tax=Desulforamulus hydrothermalis Lam5 = DSM 18033 TaxID=1121428 RepID=K8DYC0_9FIRM|nr:EutP/PduV family microcompartment system protein [Desulforamulus hydrothermalis]CCO07720.1 putative nucleoside triphosphate hydrolase domain protein [Desulforamulus hydrothermalis Lam5 = DSM 18033]SHH33732.1 ethanolamine utilization protein EutP [Desulforamulus hydrothermalis Lam5 = DSM 18033]